MKNSHRFAFAFWVAFILSSCSEKETTNDQPISDEEAIEQAASSLQSEFSALNSSIDLFNPILSAGRSSSGRTETCGIISDSLIEKNYVGNRINYDFTLAYSISLSCSPFSIPSEILVSYSYLGDYTSSSLSSSMSSLGAYTFSQLLPSDVEWLLNGESTVEQEALLTKDTNKFINTSTLLKLNDIAINKSNGKITSGSGTLEITGETASAEKFYFEVSLTIQSANEALLKIGDKEFLFNTITGEFTQV